MIDSIRTGEADGYGVRFSCTDQLARWWTMEGYDLTGKGRDPERVLLGATSKHGLADLSLSGADIDHIAKVFIPTGLLNAIGDAFGDIDHRYEAKCRDLEAELKRAHEIIRALSDAVSGVRAMRPPRGAMMPPRGVDF